MTTKCTSIHPITALQAGRIACEASAWSLTNLQLQKILYIAQMIFLGKNDQPLIEDDFEAWDYGPVLPTLYQRVKVYGAQPIQNVFNDIDTESTEHTSMKQAIVKACQELRLLTPARLVSFTHRPNGAWDKNYTPGILRTIIPQRDILEEYKALKRDR